MTARPPPGRRPRRKSPILRCKTHPGPGRHRAYIAALLAGENARMLTESAGYMRQEQEIAEARFSAGDIAEADQRQIQVDAEPI